MKKIVKGIVAFFAAAVLAVTSCPLLSIASSTYTLTFRAGNAGSFDVTKVESAVKKKALVSVKPEYLKVTASRGQSVEDVFYQAFGRGVTQTSDFNALFLGFLKENKEYTMLSEASWGPRASDTVRHNEEYVLDYGVLVDPVLYSVTFVDEESREAVAAPVMGYGSEGEKITFAPVTVDDYESDDGEQSMVLSKDSENTLTFSYKYTGVTYIPGKTVVRTVYDDVTNVVTTTVQTQNHANAGNGQQSNHAGNGQPAGNAGVDVDGQQAGDARADGNGQQADGAGAANGEQQIEDENVPLAPGNDAEHPAETKIGEEEVPLASRKGKNVYDWMGYVLAGTVVVTGCVIVAVIVRKKRRS